MKTRLIAIVFGLVCLAAAPSIASAQYLFGVPNPPPSATDTPPSSQGR
jgi:hypothetical protein